MSEDGNKPMKKITQHAKNQLFFLFVQLYLKLECELLKAKPILCVKIFR